jgi:sRNA-binding regulator protein Hfq
VKNFDRFAVIVEIDGKDELIFKHAIATIASDRTVANYFPSHHS